MKYIKDLSIDNFTKFSHVKFEFSKEINVFIGKNGTGKTHILKLLYLIQRLSQSKYDSNSVIQSFKTIFRTENLDSLIRNFQSDDFTINFHRLEDEKDYYLQYISTEKRIDYKLPEKQETEGFYFPNQEIISSYLGFIPIYEKYDLGWEENIYTAAKALFLPKLKETTSFQKNILPKLASELGGTLLKEEGKFYLQNQYGKIQTSLLAEGEKKLASLIYLIENGTIHSNTILFWDEPELHLKPKLITVFTKIFNAMASEGVQVFLSTHDYLLSHQLSLLDEYRKDITEEKVSEIKFFCLEDTEEGVAVYSGKNLTEIPNNPILEEFSNHYDRERELFVRTLKDE